MDISVVIPVYNEVEALPELYRALTDTLDQLPQSAEVIFADDGSKDGSAAALDSIAEGDPRVRVLHLSRNYGQTAALMAAIQNSTGDVIIPMDGDGQNDPADIPRLLAKLAEGYDLVSGWRPTRQDDGLARRPPPGVPHRRTPPPPHWHFTISGAPPRPTGARSSRMSASTARCTASSRSTLPGKERASPSSPWPTTRAASAVRNTASAASSACCSIS